MASGSTGAPFGPSTVTLSADLDRLRRQKKWLLNTIADLRQKGASEKALRAHADRIVPIDAQILKIQHLLQRDSGSAKVSQSATKPKLAFGAQGSSSAGTLGQMIGGAPQFGPPASLRSAPKDAGTEFLQTLNRPGAKKKRPPKVKEAQSAKLDALPFDWRYAQRQISLGMSGGQIPTKNGGSINLSDAGRAIAAINPELLRSSLSPEEIDGIVSGENRDLRSEHLGSRPNQSPTLGESLWQGYVYLRGGKNGKIPQWRLPEGLRSTLPSFLVDIAENPEYMHRALGALGGVIDGPIMTYGEISEKGLPRAAWDMVEETGGTLLKAFDPNASGPDRLESILAWFSILHGGKTAVVKAKAWLNSPVGAKQLVRMNLSKAKAMEVLSQTFDPDAHLYSSSHSPGNRNGGDTVGKESSSLGSEYQGHHTIYDVDDIDQAKWDRLQGTARSGKRGTGAEQKTAIKGLIDEEANLAKGFIDNETAWRINKFIDSFGDYFFKDIDVDIVPEAIHDTPSGPIDIYGDYNYNSEKIRLARTRKGPPRELISPQEFMRTFTHEFAHHLTKYLDPEQFALLEEQYKRERTYAKDKTAYRYKNVYEWISEKFSDIEMADDAAMKRISRIDPRARGLIYAMYKQFKRIQGIVVDGLLKRGKPDHAKLVYHSLKKQGARSLEIEQMLKSDRGRAIIEGRKEVIRKQMHETNHGEMAH